ncbi:MAG: hypothetical protein RR714_05540, partial [Aurantimicrobium sp.]
TTEDNTDADGAKKITTRLRLDALVCLFELHPAGFELTLKVCTGRPKLRMQLTSRISPAVFIAIRILVHGSGQRKG